MIKIRTFKLVFLVVCYRADRDLEMEIVDTNGRLKNYCSSNGFIFVDKSTINESCLNMSKLHLNKKGMSMWPITSNRH